MRLRQKATVLLVAGLLGGASLSWAGYELMQIEQVIGGVAGDPTAQAIQLRMRAPNQGQLQAARLVAYDAQGEHPIIIVDMGDNMSNAATSNRVLIASPNLGDYTVPPVDADYPMANLIPTNYLAAGRLTYESDVGVIYWSVSWGGASYTGSNSGNTTNDADGDFGPPFNGALPTTRESALVFTNSPEALSRSNLVDYVILPGAAVLSNNLRQSFTVVPKLKLKAVTREANNIRLTWVTRPGRSNYVQVTAETATGDFTNNFTDLNATPIIPVGTGDVETNYLDLGGATNSPARYYRVRVLP